MSKRVAIALFVAVILSCAGRAEVYILDSFDGNSGGLNNTRPDQFEKSLAKTAWWKDDGGAFVRGEGRLRCVGNQPATCVMMMPPAEKGQKISIGVSVNPVSLSDSGKIHFGLSNHRKNVRAKGGQVWVSLWMPPGKNSGAVFVYGGDGRTRHLLAKHTGITFDRPITLSYSTSDGMVEVLDGDSPVYAGPVTYNGLEGQSVPLENIKCVGFEFDGVAGSDTENPAEISEVKIKIEK